MRRWLIVLAVVLLAVLALAPGTVWAADAAPAESPFSRPATETSAPAVEPTVFQQAIAYINEQQRHLYRQLAESLRAVQSENTVVTMAGLVLLSFLYGVFHAAGPGHGKAVISAYLVANERAVRRGVALSFAASLTQAVTAIVLVSGVLFVFKGLGVTTKQTLGPLTLISAVLIAAIGAWMLLSSVRALIGRLRATRASGSHSVSCGGGGCGHDHHAHSDHVSGPLTWGKAGAIVGAVGLRPCSGAVFVLLFANTIGLYAAGVWSTLAMALGTAITVSFLAIITLWSKEAAVRLAGFKAAWVDWTYSVLGIAGALAILVLGVVLLMAATSPQSPFPVGA